MACTNHLGERWIDTPTGSRLLSLLCSGEKCCVIAVYRHREGHEEETSAYYSVIEYVPHW